MSMLGESALFIHNSNMKMLSNFTTILRVKGNSFF